MALNSIGLGFVFTAKNFASTSIQKLNRDFQGLDRTVDKAAGKIRSSIQHKLMTGLALATTGAAGLRAGFQAASNFGDFEQGMARVYAVTGASSEQMLRLKDSVIRAGIETQFSPDEAVKGMNELVTRGLNVKQSIEALTPALNLAAAGQMSIASAGSTTASALKVFGLQASDAADAANKLLKIETLTALKSKDLEIALGTVGRGANLTGQSLHETMIMLGLVRNTGLETSASATAVSTSLLMMAKNSKKLQDQLGVDVTDDATGKFRDMGDIVLDVGKKLAEDFPNAADRARKATELFNMRGLSGFAAVYRQLESGIEDATGQMVYGADALAFLRVNMTEMGDVAGDMKTKLNAGFKGQKELLEGVGKTFMLSIGEPFANVLKPVLTSIRVLLKSVIQLVLTLPMGLKNFGVTVLMASAALVLFGGAALIVVAAMTGMKMAAPAIITAFSPLVPFILPVVAAIGLMTLGFLAFKNAMAFFPGMSDAFQATRDKVSLLASALSQVFMTGRLSGEVLREMLEGSNSGVREFFEGIVKLKSRVTGFIDGLVEGFRYTTAAIGPTFLLIKGIAVLLIGTFFRLFGVVQDAGPGIDTFTSSGRMLGQALGNLTHLITIALPFYAAYKTATIAMATWTFLGAVATGAATTAKGLHKTALIGMWAWMVVAQIWTKKYTTALKANTAWSGAAAAAEKVKKVATRGYAVVLGVVSVAQAAWSVIAGTSTIATSGLAMSFTMLFISVGAILGPLLAVIAVFAGTFYLGKWIFGLLGVHDAIAKVLGGLTGLNAELKHYEDINGGADVSTRVSASTIKPGETGMTFVKQGSRPAGTINPGGPSTGATGIAADMERLSNGGGGGSNPEAEFARLMAEHSKGPKATSHTTKVHTTVNMDGKQVAESHKTVLDGLAFAAAGAALGGP